MPHNNGYIYSTTDANGNRIGVNTDDISVTIGVGSHDIGYLCSNAHGQTNPFAKFKPVIYDNPDSVANFWKANDGNCGLSPYHLNGVADVVSHCNGTMNGWVYNAPSGSNFYRQTDFDGYNHKAVKPLQNGLIVPSHVYDGDTLSIGFPWMKGTDTIGFDDIAITKDTYWCFFMIKNGSGTKLHGTTTTKAADAQGGIIDILTTSIPQRVGTWKIYPCLSTTSYNYTDGYPASDYYSIPFVSPITVVIESASNKVTISVTTTRVVGSTAYFRIKVTNNTLNAIIFNNNSWQLRKSGVSETAGITVTEKTGTLDSFSLASGASKEITLTASADCVQTGADIIINLQSGAYKYRGPVDNRTPVIPIA